MHTFIDSRGFVPADAKFSTYLAFFFLIIEGLLLTTFEPNSWYRQMDVDMEVISCNFLLKMQNKGI